MEAPISASQGAMRSLPGKLESLLLGRKHNLRPEEKNKLRILQGDLQGLIENFLLEPSEVESPASTASFWMKDMRDLSFDIDDFLDELAEAGTSGSRTSTLQTQKLPRVKISRFPKKLKRHQWIADEISGFRTRVKEAIERHKTYLGDCKWRSSSSSGQLGERPHSPILCSISLVSVERSIKQLCGWLTNDGQPEHKVVSIVGTGGVGKTTLAKEVYHKLEGQFECRAFVWASRKPDMKRLFTSILSQVRRHQLPDSCEVHKLVLNINKYLQNKTYIIVIDDLWASSTWDIVNHALPKGNCCSRILTTTEVDAIAQTCSADSSKYMPSKKEVNSKYIFKKEPLNEDESRELLLGTVFGLQAECPQGLKEVSNEIIKRSGGLPLTISILAILLARQPSSSLEQWNCINNSLSSCLTTNNSLEGINQVLNLGYDNLPCGLKACMLYLCMYEEDRVILKVDLVKQWMAEGFICMMEGEDGNEVARSYFDELVNRGMIQPVDINCNDEILSCKVHHIVLRFIRYKSIEENFSIAIDHSQTAIRLADKVRRLALHFGNVEDATLQVAASMRLSKVRSLAFSGLLKCMPSIVEFRFLQVLILKLWADPDNRSDKHSGSGDLSGNIPESDDLTDNLTEPDDVSCNLTEISQLFRLRYFHLDACYMSVELPTQMQRLKDLIAWEIDAEVTAVASDIVHLPSLLYLSIPSEAHLPTGIGRMTSLRTLGVIDLSKNSTENVMSLHELTNLQDLRLTCSTLQPDNLENNLECLGSIIRKLRNLKCLTLVPAVSPHLSNQHDASASRMSCSWHGFTIMPLAPALLQRLELSWRCCIFSRLPEWTNELTNLCILKIAIRKLSSNGVVILRGLPSLTTLSLFVWTVPVRRFMFRNEGFLVLKYFKFVCAAPCLAFSDGAMTNVRFLKLGFNGNRMERYNLLAAGFDHLISLNKISIKIGCAFAPEYKKTAKAVLTDAIRNHPRTPIINVKCVDWNFSGDGEEYIEAQKEIWNQTSRKQDATTRESSDGHGVKEKDLEEDARKQADIRTSTPPESTSQLYPDSQNAAGARLCLENEMASVEVEVQEGPNPGIDDDKDVEVKLALRVVEQWGSLSIGDRSVFDSPEDTGEYLAAATCLAAMAGTRVEATLQVAMARLEEEFRQLLIRRSIPLAKDYIRRSLVADGEISPYLISPDTVSTLKDIAGLMLHGGLGPKLCQVYGEVIQYKVMECLTMLGVDKMSLKEVQSMEWSILDNKMKKWIQALKVLIQGLLAEERRICSQIFAAYAYGGEDCFTQVAKASVLQLLRFGDTIAIGKISQEKIFHIIGMYEALAELLPEIVALFSGEARGFMKEEAERTLVGLGEAVRCTVAEFVNTIHRDTSRISLPDGGIHPLTQYVMNYVVLLADYGNCLNHLLDGCESGELEISDMTPLGHTVMILITHLWDKIEDKAELYDDEALQNIFLLNNLLCIVQKVMNSELKTWLGDKWLCTRGDQMRTYFNGYLQSSWNRVIACLSVDGLLLMADRSSALKDALKERFKNFNWAYEALYMTQTTWKVVEPQLRERLKLAISINLIPAYRSYVARYRGQLEGLNNFTEYVKYSPEDLENQILDFFEG
ncbi:hypothetical protein QYE76_014956 [Lolium multiflorum]|uniref:Exocyst subunit Exo70 family protein n=1 Tax=Lolium multiflorum TaxID=4521 RepID=A0AAD8U5P5_LOLMU|nr:hypothetical protein QYE76_014956 [Lolium multiflorum]